MVYESDFGAVSGWHLMAPGACSHGILVVWFSKTLSEKSKEWVSSSVVDKATRARASPAYNPMTAVVFVVIYDGRDPAPAQLSEGYSQGYLSWGICQ